MFKGFLFGYGLLCSCIDTYMTNEALLLYVYMTQTHINALVL